MNRAAFGNSQEPGTLLVAQIAVERELALNMVQQAGEGFASRAVCGVHAFVTQPHRGVPQSPAFALGVHSDRHGGAGAERGQQQIVGTGAAVGAAEGGRLVGGQVMAAGRDALAAYPASAGRLSR
jgi:hypothetical protein